MANGICVVRRSRKITPDEACSVIRGVFARRDVQVEVIEVSQREVATIGTLRFSVHDLPLTGDPARAFTWNGWYVEPDGRKRPVWARVRLKETVIRAIALKDLAVGEVLTRENVRLEPREAFPATETETPEAVWGQAPRSPVLEGAWIDPKRLAKVPAIRKGDTILLEAVTPQSRLTIPGTAESTAYTGQRLTVITSLSKKAVRATATGQGRAIAADTSASPATSSLK